MLSFKEQFQQAKERAKRALLNEMRNDLKKEGKPLLPNLRLWCDFCFNTHVRRWEVKLITDPKYKDLIPEHTRNYLRNSKLLFACDSCIEKHQMKTSLTLQSATFEGQSEALKIILEGENENENSK